MALRDYLGTFFMASLRGMTLADIFNGWECAAQDADSKSEPGRQHIILGERSLNYELTYHAIDIHGGGRVAVGDGRLYIML
jgi:hypothetical protein